MASLSDATVTPSNRKNSTDGPRAGSLAPGRRMQPQIEPPESGW